MKTTTIMRKKSNRIKNEAYNIKSTWGGKTRNKKSFFSRAWINIIALSLFKRRTGCIAHQNEREKKRRRIGGFHSLYCEIKIGSMNEIVYLYEHFFIKNNIFTGDIKNLAFIKEMYLRQQTYPNHKIKYSQHEHVLDLVQLYLI